MLVWALQAQLRAQPRDSSAWQRVLLHGAAIRYVDWLLPGALAVNMLLSCFFGVGYVIVRYRRAQILRRLKVTPTTQGTFLLAQVLSRLWLVLLLNVVLYVGCDLLLDFRREGSLVNLFLVLSLGACCLITLSMAICARMRSEELADGVLDFVSWPMMLLSEVWFSIEGAHPAVSHVAQLLPLTHIVKAARAVMLDGASLPQILPELALLAGLTGVFMLISIVCFRWE